ncbi:Defensin-like protein [Caenorhabditis elegans]|uniref:Defensin-like protein n=1 Tax=Caenorhabditis elegans TaxID=6239 RepID=B3WFX1_CAEEL|nr:Defensin-like protein [Caenorhabditis elegans]CAQ76471.1 Defensin-like protein [Caenorhabditis elegans]|eukprot:NP_001129766.1 Regulatory Gene for Behavioral Aging [Caenorhabditis elegans]
MFGHSTSFCLLALFVLSMTVNCKDPWYDWKVGKGLNGRSSFMGYQFDSPLERNAIKGYRYLSTRGRVTDCNSNCRYYYNANSGYCAPSRSNDCSTYCGCGFVCRCR